MYRTARGFVRGRVGADGVFRGVWCEGSELPERNDGGIIEWRLIETKSGQRVIDGRWQIGYERRLDGTISVFAGWDLHKLRNDHAEDLVDRLKREPVSAYCGGR